ncbi:MAG TPA: glycoside hydrolase family 3 N-terminal domain-containing protein [Solirubrobacterales bacterium]|nr:glycoside hydrolase family 3 N-terminal domain-containing protein [Solirubrobacterales bacterium]
MERRGPPESDEGFEWTDSPARPSRSREPSTGEGQAPDTGERDRVGSGEDDRPGTAERGAVRRETGSFQAIREGIAERRREKEETGEFERSGRTPPTGRRSRHRDLPARVRRREAAVVGVIALAVIIGLIVLITSGGGGGGEQTIGLKRLVGQSIVARLGAKGPDQALIRRVKQGRVGGVIAFDSDANKLKADVATLQQAARTGDSPPLLVMIDQEGGDVKRLPQGPPNASPTQLGRSDDENQSRDQGQATGSYLRGLGLNVDLAPVLDVSQPNTADTIKSRTFGSDPAVVAKVGVAFAQGLQDGGVVATPKHFPGLGRATVSPDDNEVAIAATSQELQGDLEPFKAAIAAGAKMMMVSTASYPTLGSEKQAALSAGIVSGLLRDQLGFKGVVITDDMEAPAVTGSTSPVVAASSAIKAGDDMLLYARSVGASDRAFKSLVSEVKAGNLNRSLFQEAYDRITALKDSPTG